MTKDIVYPVQPFFVLNAQNYYKKLLPHSAVAHFYSFTSKEQMLVKSGAVPDGAVDIIFSCREGSPQAIIAGSVPAGINNVFEENTPYFGIRLLPGIFDHFKNISVKELTGNRVDLSELTGSLGLAERIYEAECFQSRVREFINSFPEVLHSAAQPDAHAILIQEILRRIYQREGNISIQELERELLYSRRHLLRIFKDFTGIDIKKFCRIIRFQATLSQLNLGGCPSLAIASADHGYYDQNHFQKDFKEFTLMSPGSYLKLIRENRYQKQIILLE